MKFYLDGVDVTNDIIQQLNIPDVDGGVYPNEGIKWFNLFPIVQAHPTELGRFFSAGGLHSLRIDAEDTEAEFDAKIILRMCYSARNS